MTSEPAGIGEKGTGQTESTMERSGIQKEQSGAQGGGQSQSKSAMDRPDR